MNNLGRLRDTIQFGFNFNLLVNSRENFNKHFAGNWNKCNNKEKEVHNGKLSGGTIPDDASIIAFMSQVSDLVK